jgi:plastocyanin
MRSPRHLYLHLAAVPVLAAGAAPAPRATPPAAPTVRTAAAHDRVATASIEGRVEVSRALTARRPRFRIYAEPGAGSQPPKAEAADGDERRNIVVYIERVATGAPATPAARPVLRQSAERFTPHVLPVIRGTTVEFPNDDLLFHNVFSLSRAKDFDLGRYPRGIARSVTFERPGIVQVFCHIHSDMSAVVVVLDNPYYAVPDAEGRYAIPALPPGDYTLVAWHERIKPITHRLHLEAGQLAKVDFTIPLPAGEAARER